MSGLRETYQERLENLSLATSLQKRRLQLSSLSRLGIFIIIGWLLYMAFSDSYFYAFPAFLLLVLFAYLVARHQDLKYEFRRLNQLTELNQTEIRVFDGVFNDLPDGLGFREPDHAFSGDLDLFGPHSFYQYLNRTGLDYGAHTLADQLRSNQISNIPDKQEAIRELAPQMEWRQDFTATARMIKTPVSIEELTGWMQGYLPHIPVWIRFLAPFYSFLSLAAGIGVLLGSVPVEVLVILFFGGLLITLLYSRHVSRLAAVTGKMQETLRQYQRLMTLLEEQSFQSGILQEFQNGLIREGNKVSETLKGFNRRISALDQRNNLLVVLFGNAFFLWDLRQAYGVESWIGAHGKEVGSWFRVLGHMDAYNSLANFAFNHPGYTYPTLSGNEDLVMEARQLAHPLIFEDVVPNDFKVQKGHFIVITGANMAGKSTFLRSVALAIVMANTGLPVSAASMVYKPIPLISSMRTSDSLTRHESYFFAELKRLKMIVDHLAEGPYFVLLDEILKGTNSRDKAKGSREFLERLLSMQATGLIATHDLSLCEVADQLETVHNFFFDAHIRDGELYFDYQFRPGVCSNMNASFLLRKLGVVREET